jgi:hypothetical protein
MAKVWDDLARRDCRRCANRQALSYLYFEEEQGGRAARDLPATPADLGRVFQ